MPDATITSTASTFGSISGTFAADQSTIAGTITAITGTVNGSVGVPGPQGPSGPTGNTGPQGDPGPPGVGVPSGGTTGQYLVKASGTSYDTVWQTLSISGYATEAWVTAGFYPLTGNPSGFLTSAALTPYLPKAGGYITGDLQSSNNSAYRSWDGAYNTSVLKGDYLQLTNSNTGGNALTIEWSGITFPSGKQTVHYPGTSILSGYATEAWVTAGFAPIAAGQPASGTVGQVLTKNSGTSYDSSWQTLIPGDRYLTTSTTSLTVSNGTKTLTVGTGLSYSPQQDVVISYDGTAHMHAVVTSYNSTSGAMVVDVTNHTGSGTYSAWTVNVGGTTPLASVYWGDILGTLGDQTDLATALNAKLEITDAASTYYLQTNPAGYITSSALYGYATQAWVDAQGYLQAGALTGYATESWVTAGFYPLTGNPSGFLTSSSLTGYATQSWVTSQGYLTSASLTGYAQLSGSTFTGLVSTPASTTTSAGLRIAPGAAPTTPVNGDVWTTTSGLFARINGGTQQYAPLGSTNTFTGTNTFSGATVSFGTSTAASTINVGTGATLTATTKAVNIGTNGVAGSTTNIAIGSTTGTSTTTLQGSTIGATLAADTNTTGLATTAFVVGQAGSATPLINGTAAVGTSLRYARQDHVHPTDTSRAALASPTFTGTPLSTTAAVDTNTTQIATTAFVIGQASSSTPSATGTAAVGTSLKYARADHVHANPLPTGGTTGQVLSKVDGTNYNVAWTTVASGSSAWGSITGTLSSQTDLQSALDAKLDTTTASSTYVPLNGATMTDAAGLVFTYSTGDADSTLNGYQLKIQKSSDNTVYSSIDQNGFGNQGNGGQVTITPGDINIQYVDTTGGYTDSGSIHFNQNSSTYYNSVTTQNLIVRPSGITFPDATIQSTAFTGFAGYATESWVTTQLGSYLTTSAAASTYQTQAGMSSYLTTASAASTYQTQAGMSSYLTTSAASTTYAALAGSTFTGLVSTPASTTTTAGLRIAHGAAPTTPVNGDIWTTTSGLFMRQNGTTQQYVDFASTQTINGTKTFSASSITLGNSTAAGTIALGTGATISGSTKTVNIGTGGVAGSTTAITIGSTTGTSTTTLQGTTNGVTPAALTNTTALATTAFVRSDNNVKAWVSFNGTGTVAINANYNVTSITDNGVGDYTVNFTSALADANYGVAGYARNGAGTAVMTVSAISTSGAQTSSACRLTTGNASTLYDNIQVNAVFYR
jgi:hypothetical protein